MTNRRRFAIPSLLAAGVIPMGALAADDGQTATDSGKSSYLDKLDGLISGIEESHRYTLAAHSSHVSHGSHGSHQSHRSSGMRLEPPTTRDTAAALGNSDTRNVSSTPPNSVLPSSAAIAKKLTVLPGNSKKFQDLVMRVQIALMQKGYDVGAVDGSLHARSTAAIYRYQDDRGMVPSGKLTPETLSALGITAQ